MIIFTYEFIYLVFLPLWDGYSGERLQIWVKTATTATKGPVQKKLDLFQDELKRNKMWKYLQGLKTSCQHCKCE